MLDRKHALAAAQRSIDRQLPLRPAAASPAPGDSCPAATFGQLRQRTSRRPSAGCSSLRRRSVEAGAAAGPVGVAALTQARASVAVRGVARRDRRSSTCQSSRAVLRARRGDVAVEVAGRPCRRLRVSTPPKVDDRGQDQHGVDADDHAEEAEQTSSTMPAGNFARPRSWLRSSSCCSGPRSGRRALSRSPSSRRSIVNVAGIDARRGMRRRGRVTSTRSSRVWSGPTDDGQRSRRVLVRRRSRCRAGRGPRARA